MSWAYCAPKSTTRTGRGSLTSSLAHPHALGLLFPLALGLDGGRHHDPGLLELLQVGVARGGHRRPERAEQVQGPVVLVRRADQDLLEGPDAPRGHPRPPRKVRL